VASHVLEIDSLVVDYGRLVALNGVSLRFTEGVTGLLGPNGAGKSSLMRVLATASTPRSGRVLYDGVPLGSTGTLRQLRSTIGYLPQNPGLYPSFRVGQFVEHIALLKELADRRTRRDEVERVLAEVELSDHTSERISTLSGGMRQRLALACALVGDPRLLVLDEPTVGMDPEQRIRFRETVGRSGRNKIVILSTHQTDDVAALCSTVVVLQKGSVRFTGTPLELTGLANGHVWASARPDVAALASWDTGTGVARNVGTPPKGAEALDPSLDDGYLLATAAVGESL